MIRLLFLWFLWILLWLNRIRNHWSIWDFWNLWCHWNIWNCWGFWDLRDFWNHRNYGGGCHFRRCWRGVRGNDRIRRVAIPTQLSLNAGVNQSSQREHRLRNVNDNKVPHDNLLVCVDTGVISASFDSLRDEG